jgi:uncharacterized protein (TIGR03437 family)
VNVVLITGLATRGGYRPSGCICNPRMAIVLFIGYNPAGATLTADRPPYPLVLGGTAVQMNNQPVPLFFVSPTQINFEVPWEFVGVRQASLTVTVNGVTSSPVSMKLPLSHEGCFPRTHKDLDRARF